MVSYPKATLDSLAGSRIGAAFVRTQLQQATSIEVLVLFYHLIDWSKRTTGICLYFLACLDSILGTFCRVKRDYPLDHSVGADRVV